MESVLVSVADWRRVARAVSARGMGLAVVGLLLCALCAESAFAARFIVLEDECRGKQLLLSGPIEPGDAERFARALAQLVSSPDLPDVQDQELLWTVKLDSSGGDIGEAMVIGRLLRKALASTEVSYRFAPRADGIFDFERSKDTICLEGEGRLSGCFSDIVKAECAGACLLAWLGGADRYAHEGNLGTHGLWSSAVDDASIDETTVRAYLQEMTDADAARAVLVAPQADGERWLPWADRSLLAGRARSLQQALAACPAALSQQESMDSVMHADRAVRDRLMDRAADHRTCRLAIQSQAQDAVRAELLSRFAAR